MAGIRELVTYLRYKVDNTGLKEYVKEADKAADDVEKATKRAQSATPKAGPQGQRIINLPGQGPGYFDTTPGGKPRFIPISTPEVPSGGFRMPNPEQIAIAERQAQRAAIKEREREANDEARAQKQIAEAERQAHRRAADDRAREEAAAERNRMQMLVAERQAQRASMREAARQAAREEREVARQAARERREAARQAALEAREARRAEALAAREAAANARAQARANALAARQRNQTIVQGGNAGRGFLGGIREFIGPALAAIGIHEITHIADEWATVNARIGLVTDNAKEQRDVLDQIYGISNRTRQSYEETANLVFNMRQATEHAGISMQDTLKAAENFNKALIVGGGTAANNRRAIYELNHALEIGHLGGMQLRSLRMEAPIFIRTLSEQLAGGDAEKLSKMATAGLLKTKVIVDALNKATDTLDKKFQKMPLTIGQAVTVSGNMFGKLVNDIGQTSGAFSDFAHAIVWGTETFIGSIRGIADLVGGFGEFVRLIEILALAFTGTKLILGLNTMAMAFEAGGLAAVAAAVPFAVIFGLLVGIGLLIEDIYGFLHGKKSLTGDYFDLVYGQLKKIQDIWPDIESSITDGFKKIGDWIDFYFIAPIRNAIGYAEKFASMLGINLPGPDSNTPAPMPGFFGRAAMGVEAALSGPFGASGSAGKDYIVTPEGQVIHLTQNINTADNPQAIGAAAAQGAAQGARAGNAARSLGNSYPNTEAK